MELLLYIVAICFLALMFSSVLSNQQKKIKSNKRIEKKLDTLIDLLDKENTKSKLYNPKGDEGI